MREALFSSIESWCGSLQGLRFLDLYAGSGAVGLEAWSRGAGVVTLVESDRRTARLIADNARALGFAKADVVAAIGRGHRWAPRRRRRTTWSSSTRPTPSADDAVAADLALLDDHGWLVPGAMVVVERSSRSPEPRVAAGHRGHPQQALRRDRALVRSRRRDAPRRTECAEPSARGPSTR